VSKTQLIVYWNIVMLSWLLIGVLMTSLFSVGVGQNATTDPPPTCKLVLANNQTMLGIRQSFVDASQGQKVSCSVVFNEKRVIATSEFRRGKFGVEDLCAF
jgi:hypothetical protein